VTQERQLAGQDGAERLTGQEGDGFSISGHLLRQHGRINRPIYWFTRVFLLYPDFTAFFYAKDLTMLSGGLPNIDAPFPSGRHDVGKGEFSQSLDHDDRPELATLHSEFFLVILK
jgi:hypothetical protein